MIDKDSYINIIVAAGRDGAIGRNGDLIWRIPSDLRRFKSLTMGHAIIMGRKTWESLPKRPLPGRLNIIVTRQEGYEAEWVKVAHTPEEAVIMAFENGDRSPFIIGGAQLYETLIPYADRIYLTEVDAVCEDADARISFPLDADLWRITETTDREQTPEGTGYRYVTYERQ